MVMQSENRTSIDDCGRQWFASKLDPENEHCDRSRFTGNGLAGI